MNPFPKAAAALFGAAVVVGVLFIGQSFLETRRLFLVAASACLAIIAVAVLAASRRGPTVFFDAKIFGLAGILVFLVVGMLKSVFIYETPVTLDISTATKAVLVAASALAGFLLGSARGFRVRRLGRFSRGQLSTPRLLFLTLLLGVVGLVGLWQFKNPLQEYDPTASKYAQLVAGCLPAAGALALWLLFTVRPRTPARRLLFWAALLPWPPLAVISTSRMPLAFLVSFGFVLYVYRLWSRGPKPFPVGRVAVLGVAVAVGLLFSAAVVDVLADYNWGLDPNMPSLLQAAEGKFEGFTAVDAFDNLVRVVQLYPDRDRYLYGWSLLALVVNPIPRSAWPEKPYGFDRLLVEELGQAAYRGHSVSPSLAGELLANFGYLGPFVGYLLLGLLGASLYERFLQAQPYSPFHALYLAGLIVFLLESRGGFLVINVRFGWYLAVLYVALRLSAVGMKRERPARGPVWSPAPAGR